MIHYSVKDLYDQRYAKLTGRVPTEAPGSADTEPGVRFLLLPDTAEQEMGSRSHPGPAAHTRAADQLQEEIMKMEYERGIVRYGSTARLQRFFKRQRKDKS